MFEFSKFQASKSSILGMGVITLLCCLGGLSWQTFQISQPYFQFKVITNIKIHWPDFEEAKILNICYNFFEDMFETKFGSDNFTIGQLWFGSQEIRDMLVAQESDKGPKSCYGHRDSYNHAHCKDIKITKYTFNGHSCFSFSLENNSVTFDREYLINHHHDSTLLKVNIPMTRQAYGSSGHLFLTENGESPVRVMNRGVPENNLRFRVNYRMKYYCLHIEKLTYPYNDNCIYYGKDKDHSCDTRGECFMECMNNFTTRVLGGVFPYSTNYAPLNLSYHRIDNEETLKQYDNAFHRCSNLYRHSDCKMKTTLTHIERLSARELNRSFYLSYALGETPTTEIVSSPKIAFIDFLTFIFGALGIWIGFSFMNFNPARLMIDRGNKPNLSDLHSSHRTLFDILFTRTQKLSSSHHKMKTDIITQNNKIFDLKQEITTSNFKLKADVQQLNDQLVRYAQRSHM